MDECVFCRILRNEIPSRKIYEDEKLLVIEDIAPVAPVHFLFIPKKHFANCLVMSPEDNNLLGHVFQVAGRLAREKGVAAEGFRIVNNTNEAAGQSVYHIHFHMIAGRHLAWPPG